MPLTMLAKIAIANRILETSRRTRSSRISARTNLKSYPFDTLVEIDQQSDSWARHFRSKARAGAAPGLVEGPNLVLCRGREIAVLGARHRNDTSGIVLALNGSELYASNGRFSPLLVNRFGPAHCLAATERSEPLRLH